MWKNKHVVIAMLVAPVLAVIAWYGVDYMVSERAEAAKPGESYPLVARSNCRYDSGVCDLTNNDFKLTLKPVELSPNQTTLSLESEYSLANATVSLVNDNDEVLGISVASDSPETGTRLKVTIPAFTDPAAALRVAVTVQQSIYYAEVPVLFLRSGPGNANRR